MDYKFYGFEPEKAPLGKWRSGFYYFKEELVYYIEQVMYEENSYVFVYEAEYDRYNKPRKKRDIQRVQESFLDSKDMASLAGIAERLKRTRKRARSAKQIEVESEQLFMAPVVMGVDTILGGNEQFGFYERNYRKKDDELTGVFISIDSIQWVTIPHAKIEELVGRHG